jgi:hypothetical protein
VRSAGSVGADRVTLFCDGLRQRLSVCGAVNVNAVGGPVNRHHGLRVNLLHGGFDSAFAVTAGHAGNVKGLVHQKSPWFDGLSIALAPDCGKV